MTFNEYVNTVWPKERPLAAAFSDKEELPVLRFYDNCSKKVDWINYCVKNGDLNEINRDELAHTFEEQIALFESWAKDETCTDFIGPDYVITRLFRICRESFSFDENELVKMDERFLDRMVKCFIELFRRKVFSCDVALNKALSWYKFRKGFCLDENLGFSPKEYYIPFNFYVPYKQEVLALRNLDYGLILELARYSLWIYENGKEIPSRDMGKDIYNFNEFAMICCRNTLVAARNNGFFEYEESIINTIRGLRADRVYNRTVFISYNWREKDLVDRIENEISKYVTVKRDITKLEIGDNITEFMNSIRDEDFALVVISDAYLKSEACIYELTTLFMDKGTDAFSNKVMFLVCDDARSIFNPEGRGEYIEFWENRRALLEAKTAKLPIGSNIEMAQSIRTVSFICLQLGSFLEYVKNTRCIGEIEAIDEISSRVK